MKNAIYIFFLIVINNEVSAQSYFDEIVQKHLVFFYSEDSVVISEDKTIPVLHDSLTILNEKKQILKKYWETDTNGKITNLYFEVSEKTLFVVQELDTDNRLYLLYRKKGLKKVEQITWIDDGSEKIKKILVKPDGNSIEYFKGGLVF